MRTRAAIGLAALVACAPALADYTLVVDLAQPGERVPAAFVARLRASLGAQVDAILAKYAGN